MQKFNIHEAPAFPQSGGLRADPRHRLAEAQPVQQPAGHPAGVPATGDGLILSTIKAGVGALAILVFFVLPGEYGVDVTGVGRILGLTEMGEIKQQLYAEAAADEAADAAARAAPAADPQIGARLDAMEAQLSEIAAVLGAGPGTRVAAAPAAPVAPVAVAPTAMPAAPVAAPAPAPEPMWRDNASVVLAPGEGIELKMAMEEGQVARFEWSANGAVLNHDTHGDGGGRNVTYVQGRGVPGEVGELTAAFTGNHGWFWRNRTNAPVTLTLQVGGEYSRFIRP
jgi:hypothetical protein